MEDVTFSDKNSQLKNGRLPQIPALVCIYCTGIMCRWVLVEILFRLWEGVKSGELNYVVKKEISLKPTREN